MIATANRRADAVDPAGTVSPGLTVCIPVLNEQNGIAATLTRCLAVAPALRAAGVPNLEVIVVDDGSKDDTAARVREFPQVRLIQHGKNRGYGAALKTGFAAASHDLVGFIDADATYPPEQFPDLCRALHDERADLVIGSRMAGADSQMPVTRRIGNVFFARLLSVLGRTPVTDSASGMRVMRRSALALLSPLPDGLNLTPVMSTRAVHEGIKVVEVPISYRERVGASHLRITTDGIRFLRTMVWTALTYNPVRILGLIGLFGVGVALVVGGGLTVARLRGTTTLGPLGAYAVFMALVSGVAGVSLFGLGASFNYLVSLLHRRPIRQGLFRQPLLKRPVEEVFLPVGVATGLGGLLLSVVSLTVALHSWPIERLWLYLSASAMLMLVGLQLCVSWLVMSVLRELSEQAFSESPRS